MHAVNPMIVQQVCCRRAFLRGTFQASGSMSDPNKAYHFEIVCSTEEMAHQICNRDLQFFYGRKDRAQKKSRMLFT